MLNGKTLNGSMLLELCKSYVNAINQGNVPCIESAWSYVLKYESEKLIKNLVKEYEQFVKELLPKETEESLIGILKQIHEEAVPKIVEKFKETVYNEESLEFEPALLSVIDEAYKNLMKN